MHSYGVAWKYREYVGVRHFCFFPLGETAVQIRLSSCKKYRTEDCIFYDIFGLNNIDVREEFGTTMLPLIWIEKIDVFSAVM